MNDLYLESVNSSIKSVSVGGRFDQDGELEICIDNYAEDLSVYITPESAKQLRDHLNLIVGAPQSEWISVDKWEKEDCEPVWVWYSQLTDLGMFTGSDKAYWNKSMTRWEGFGLDNVFSKGAQVRYVQPLPTPPRAED